jgi:hypothetical protein
MKWLFPILNLLWKRKIRKNHCKITAEELAKSGQSLATVKSSVAGVKCKSK